MSDESDFDIEQKEYNIYKKKYQHLVDRCELLQQVIKII